MGRPGAEGETPVSGSFSEGWYPEYHETRETLWEAGWTTIQGKILLNDR